MSELLQNRDPHLVTNKPGTIGFYEREFYVLSNFSSFMVNWHEVDWPTSEHAYHAAKFWDIRPDLVARVGLARSAHDAFQLSRDLEAYVKPNWLNERVPVMTDICRAKLGQHAYIRAKLDQTADWKLVEDSPKDPFWGIGPDGQGKNQLGTIWMQLREELRRGNIEIQS